MPTGFAYPALFWRSRAFAISSSRVFVLGGGLLLNSRRSASLKCSCINAFISNFSNQQSYIFVHGFPFRSVRQYRKFKWCPSLRQYPCCSSNSSIIFYLQISIPRSLPPRGNARVLTMVSGILRVGQPIFATLLPAWRNRAALRQKTFDIPASPSNRGRLG